MYINLGLDTQIHCRRLDDYRSVWLGVIRLNILPLIFICRVSHHTNTITRSPTLVFFILFLSVQPLTCPLHETIFLAYYKESVSVHRFRKLFCDRRCKWNFRYRPTVQYFHLVVWRFRGVLRDIFVRIRICNLMGYNKIYRNSDKVK